MPKRPKTCWLITTGEAGCLSQLKGLAERLNLPWEKKLIQLPFPWKAFPGHLCPWPLKVTQYEHGHLAPPWPDVVLSAGRRTVAAALGIKRASLGRTKAIHIQDPMVPAKYFDAIVAPYHDGLHGPNVLQTLGAIHHVQFKDLQNEAAAFHPKVATLPRPFVTILLGGTSNAFQFTNSIVTQLSQQLIHLHESMGCSFLFTPSHRTPPEVVAQLQTRLAAIPCYFWEPKTPNPYKAFLGLADYILVTCDSISMISEACTTGKPVYLIPMQGHSKRQSLFFQDMERKGYVRWFQGGLENWDYAPLDETGKAAESIKKII